MLNIFSGYIFSSGYQLLFRSLSFACLIFSMSCTTSLAKTVDFQKSYDQRVEVKRFIAEMTDKHDYSQQELNRLFAKVTPRKEILDLISRPAERTLNWTSYRKIFYQQERIKLAVDFWQQHADTLARAEKQFGVPAEIITAILAVETKFGRITGRHTIFDALTTLAFDHTRRNDFFRSELESLLIMAKEEQFDPRSLKGSYAGAMGMPQFISSSYRAYAIDFDGDGKRDLFNSVPDVIGSVANYFKRHGWQTNQPVTYTILPTQSMKKNDKDCGAYGVKLDSSVAAIRNQGIRVNNVLKDNAKATILCLEKDVGNEYWLGLKNFYVISRYNHSVMYSMAVYQLSKEITKQYHYQNKS